MASFIKSRKSDGYGCRFDAPKPRLATKHQIDKAAQMREELNGEGKKKEISKVSLPKFSWDMKDDRS